MTVKKFNLKVADLRYLVGLAEDGMKTVRKKEYLRKLNK